MMEDKHGVQERYRGLLYKAKRMLLDTPSSMKELTNLIAEIDKALKVRKIPENRARKK